MRTIISFLRDPIGVRAAGDEQPVDDAVGLIGLVVPSDLVELLAGTRQRSLLPQANLGHKPHVIRKPNCTYLFQFDFQAANSEGLMR